MHIQFMEGGLDLSSEHTTEQAGCGLMCVCVCVCVCVYCAQVFSI